MDKFKFWDFGIIDFIDVFLVAILLYYIYKLVKGTVAVNIFIGIIIIYLVWRVTDFLDMYMLHRIFDGFIKVGIIALIVVFQPEIRKFLLMVGSTNLSGSGKFFKKMKFKLSETLCQVKGGAFGGKEKLIQLHKVQAVQIKQSWYQARRNLATLHITTAAENVNIPYLPLSEAQNLADVFLYRVESSKKPWM